MITNEIEPINSASGSDNGFNPAFNHQKKYEFPPLPVSEAEWADPTFFPKMRQVLKQREEDYINSGASGDDILVCSNSIIAITLAMNRSRSREVSISMHRLILDTRNPLYIQWCVNKLSIMYPDVPPSTIITLKHVDVCHDIHEEVRQWADHEKPLQLVERVIERLCELTMRNLDRSDDIISLIRRGITDNDRILSILESFDEANNPLVGGAL